MEMQPLVSVIVVCYNAADYILETLESVKAQTYKNIELIVSDDSSKDGTPEIVLKWFEENKELFVRKELITIDHNTGVSANYNRAVKACRGLWVKNLDGDDLLYDSCIYDNINFIERNPEAKLVFSNVMHFKGNNPKIEIKEHFSQADKDFFKMNAEEQLKKLLQTNLLPSQSCFVSLDLLRRFPYNEKYRGLEDEPMWITLTKNHIKAYYLDKCTAYYRITESTTSSSYRFFSPIYVESVFMYFWGEKVNYIKKYNLLEAYNKHRRTLLLIEMSDLLFKNRRNLLNNFLYNIISRLIYRFASFRL